MKASVLLLVLCISSVCGYRIISERNSIRSINNALRQNKTITLECSRSDFAAPINLTVLNDITNASTPVQINVSATDITYTRHIAGYVPRAGVLEPVECCLARDNSRYNPVQPPSSFDDLAGEENQTWGGGQSIQAVHDAHHFGLQSHALSPMARKPKFLGILFGGLLLANEFACFMKCPGKVDPWDPSSFNEFVNAANNRTAALEADAAAARIWRDAITNTTTALTLAYNDTISLFQATNESIALLRERTEVNEKMFNLSRQAIDTEIGYVRTSLSGTNEAIVNLSSYISTLVGAQNSTLQSAMNFTRAAVLNVERTLNDLQNALVDRITNLDTRMRSLNDLVFRLSGQVREAVLNFEVRRCLTRKIQARALEIENEGTYVPFIEDMGAQPSASLGPYRSILIDSVVLRYGFFSSGSFFLRRKVLTLECDTGFVLNRASDAMSWRDILDNMGPVNCDPLQFGSCSCWITINSKRCATNETHIKSNAMNSSLGFELNATFCTAAISTELTETITSPTGILDHFRGQCLNEPFLANSTGTLAGTLMPVTYSVPHRSSICGMTLNSIFGGSENNFVDTLFSHWSRGYALALTRKDVYSRIIDGRLPQNMTVYEDPFVTRNGVDMRCWTTNFMTYAADWLPVYVFKNPVMSNRVSMRIGTSNVTTQTSDVLASQPYNFALETQIRVIGNPFSTTGIYDVSAEDVSLSETGAGRLGTPTYAMVPFANMTNNLTAWRRTWNVPFKHDQGLDTASLYFRNVSGAFCTAQTAVTGGSFCDFKDYFFVYERNNTMVANAYEEKILVTLTIPEGTVVTNEFSECPVAEITPISGTVTMVKLSNNQATPVVVAIVESGACTRTLPSITIGAGLVYEHLVPLCSTGNGQVALTVSKYVGGDLESCAAITGLNVTVNRVALVAVRGVPDLKYVHETSVTEVDRTALAIAKTQAELFDLMGLFMVRVVSTIQSVTVVLPNQTYTDFTNLLTSLNKTSQDAFDRLANDSARAAFNLTALTEPYYEELANISLRQAASQADFAAALLSLRSQIVNVSSVVELLNQSLANYQATQDRLLDIERNFTAALVNFAGNVSASLTQVTRKDSLGFNFITALGGVIEDVVDGTIDLTSDVGSALYGLAKGIVKLAEKGVTGILGIPAKLMSGLTGAATGIVYLALLAGGTYMAYKCSIRNKKKRAAKEAAAKKTDAPTPKPAPAAAAAKPAPAPAAAKPEAKPAVVVAATKGSIDPMEIQDDEDDDIAEDRTLLKSRDHKWLYSSAVQRRG